MKCAVFSFIFVCIFTDVWGFDEDAVKALKNMEPELETTMMTGNVEKQFESLPSGSSNVLSTSHRTVQV